MFCAEMIKMSCKELNKTILIDSQLLYPDKACNKIGIWVSHELFATMLANCPYSDERDRIIRQLNEMEKSKSLKDWLDDKRVWELVPYL